MKLLNYVKPLGMFTDANQLIPLEEVPSDRQERKMLEEAQNLVSARIERHMGYLTARAEKTGEAVDLAQERAALTPSVSDGKIWMPLQYLQEYMTRKIAAIQNNVSIHQHKEVSELKEVFKDYKVQCIPELSALTFDYISWSARPGQKPKLMVHTKAADGTLVVIRFEAASELCQKFMNSAQVLAFKPGTVFELAVEAVDPAIEKNKRAGKQVSQPGLYVNHNLTLSTQHGQHTGHPPKGTRFLQKPTLEQLEKMYFEVKAATSA